MSILNKLTENNNDKYIIIRNNTLVTFLNPYSYVVLRKMKHIYSKFDGIEIDGIALVFFLQLFHISKKKRNSFDMSSMAGTVFEKAIESDLSIYFIGSTSNQISISVNNISQRFPGLRIVGYRHGYFENANQRKETIDHIVNLNPDVVVCGMGVPLQEEFLVDLRDAGWRGTGYTCGGFFHQSARKLEYYPRLFDKLQLRWLYRMIQEPRLAKRYLLDYPKFVFIFFWDYIQWRIYRFQGKEQ